MNVDIKAIGSFYSFIEERYFRYLTENVTRYKIKRIANSPLLFCP